MQPEVLAEDVAGDDSRQGTIRWWFVGGKQKGILYLGTVSGTLENTSMCFGGHEPPVIETMTHPVQWLREGGTIEPEATFQTCGLVN